MAQRSIPPVFVTTTPIRYRDEDGGGTGFFLNHNDRTFIVTNRHIVDPEDEDVNPTEAYVWFRNATNIGQANRNPIRFFKDGSPTWLEHPDDPSAIDIALIPINPRLSGLDVLDKDQPDPKSGNLAFTCDHFIHENIGVDQRVSIICYPGNFFDRVTLFPIRRNALIASPYGFGFENNPFFLTDARMHGGTSGSPVVMEAGGMQITHGNVPQNRSKKLYLLGIHSATFHGTSFEEQTQANGANGDNEGTVEEEADIQLDLNVAWYPELINDILQTVE